MSCFIIFFPETERKQVPDAVMITARDNTLPLKDLK
jgi:hypothetical protein